MKEKNKEFKMKCKCAQATLEFAFTFIVVVLMLYGCVKVIQWIGFSLGDPVAKHYQGLYDASPDNYCGSYWAYGWYSDLCLAEMQLNKADAVSATGLPRLNMVFRGHFLNP